MQRLTLPSRTTSTPRDGAPIGAWQGPALAAPGSGAARSGRAPSGTQRAPDDKSTGHAVRGKAGDDLPGVHRGVVHGCRSVQPQEPRNLWWQSAMPLGQYAYPLRAGYAQVSQTASGATQALDGDGSLLPHELSARWLVDQRDTNNGPPSP